MSLTLVTGATGNIGSRIVRLLAARGERVRGLARRAARPDPKIELVEGDLGDPAALRRALEGASRLYLLSTGPELARHDANAIAAARAAGVAYVVKHSVLGAEHEASEIPRWHREGERRLEQSGLAWTFLRPASFASNALGWAGSIKAAGAVYGALGEAALPVIDPEDIAEVAARILTAPGHEGKAYALTGPEALTSAQQVEILGGVLGRQLEYINVPDEAARKAMLDAGAPPAWVAAMIGLIGVLRQLGRVEPTAAVADLLGRPARSFQEWARASAAAFR